MRQIADVVCEMQSLTCGSYLSKLFLLLSIRTLTVDEKESDCAAELVQKLYEKQAGRILFKFVASNKKDEWPNTITLPSYKLECALVCLLPGNG